MNANDERAFEITLDILKAALPNSSVVFTEYSAQELIDFVDVVYDGIKSIIEKSE